MRTPARIVFHNERAMCLWVERHQRNLQVTYDRPTLHRIWDKACLGMKTEGRRAKKNDLAFDLAMHDAQTLGKDWPAGMHTERDVDACEQRVRAVGSRARWAADPTPTSDVDCPVDDKGWHGWTPSTPVCVWCGADMSNVPVER